LDPDLACRVLIAWLRQSQTVAHRRVA